MEFMVAIYKHQQIYSNKTKYCMQNNRVNLSWVKVRPKKELLMHVCARLM